MDDLTAAVMALGDQVQGVCDASPMLVAGFVLVVRTSAEEVTLEGRSQIDPQQFRDIVAKWDPTPQWRE